MRLRYARRPRPRQGRASPSRRAGAPMPRSASPRRTLTSDASDPAPVSRSDQPAPQTAVDQSAADAAVDGPASSAHERTAYARASAPGPAAPIAPHPSAAPPAAATAGDVAVVTPAPEPADDEQPAHPVARWLLEGQPARMDAPYEYVETNQHRT